MSIKKTLAGIAFAVGTLTSMSTHAWSIQEDHGSTVVKWNAAATLTRSATKLHFIVLALSPQQLAQCQQEQAQLSQQLSQCTNDACRQQVQAAIAAHNARCR